MKIGEAIRNLEKHNRWRRNGLGKSLSPVTIGIAIDTVVEEYKDVAKRKKFAPVSIIQVKDKAFGELVEVVSCCQVGPIVDEKYCPNCGRRIER